MIERDMAETYGRYMLVRCTGASVRTLRIVLDKEGEGEKLDGRTGSVAEIRNEGGLEDRSG